MIPQVTVYTSTGCPHCLKVKEQLKEWQVPYEEKNVSTNKVYFDELTERKLFGTPATFIGERFVLGFQPEKMVKLLGWTEPPAPPAASMVAEEKMEASSTDENKGLFRSADAHFFDEVYDFVVIGGGPAGASAALYAARGRLKTLVIDKAPQAGTLAITHKIANYPGVRGELTGLELLTMMHEQAADFGAELIRSNVLSVDFSDPEIKKLELPEGTIRTRTVFIGVGAKAPGSKIDGEEEFTGRGVSYCSTCDAAFFEGKSVVVSGDSEEAVHEAEALAKFSKQVQLLVPAAKFKGEVDSSRLESLSNVKVHYRHKVLKVEGKHAVERVVIQNDQREQLTWDIDGVFLYLAGMKPGTDFLGKAVDRDEEGYVNVDSEMQTSVPGVFAGGDARRTIVKQAVISAADGCIAALGAEKHVNKRTVFRPQYS